MNYTSVNIDATNNLEYKNTTSWDYTSYCPPAIPKKYADYRIISIHPSFVFCVCNAAAIGPIHQKSSSRLSSTTDVQCIIGYLPMVYIKCNSLPKYRVLHLKDTQ